MASAFHLSDRFDKTLPHHGSISTLWNNMWRPAASKGVHPFADARVEDFEPIFVELEKKGINDGYLEEYTETFQPYGAALVKQAENAEKAGDTKIAEDLYLRAAAVYRIGRFPYIINEKQQKSWERQKKYYVKGSSLGQFPILEVDIPHVHALAGRDGSAIPAYLCLPKVQASVRLPLLLMINGLDGYRTESSAWTKFACCHGWALLSLEIPGTGDCPAAADDPLSPDRLFRSVLDWVKLDDRIDENNVVAWGRSTGAYYALRLAHVNAQQVKGAVVQGLGCHRVFEEEWLRHVDQFEYSFKYVPLAVPAHDSLSSDKGF
ncbi:hypothetical protein MMC13_004157 [Lambiella insularis]|nr:hypothetical protein [Lambiella insularis]